MLALLVGCGNLDSDGGGDHSEDTQQDLLEGTRGLFLILKHNVEGKTIVLYSYDNNQEYTYQYDFSTKFFDKYGKNEPKERFTVGRVIELDAKDENGFLTGLHISDEVWEKKDIIRFAVNMEEGVFTIGDDNYSIKNKVDVFSNEDKIQLTDLWEEDVLSVVGLGNRVLSVVVTRGHGELKLVNTELFKDSLFNFGDQIFDKVSEGLVIHVPEGTYDFTVAKDGWGSTTEITIVRGEVTEVDLDSIKGDGPKKGKVTFHINVEDVKVRIDYKEVDHSQPVELVYGTHVLEISATGYTSWRGKIVVGAENSTIEIELVEEDTSSEDDKDTEKNTEKDTESKKENASTNT